ncbi:divalent-cation tolerance protein CutA [Knoellia sp. p5-6-4]|uniref:divalent-cation tolerance protein CutA n=1 Tax=unclassified Knoellia TaxID=2618719 RepID=UPI0023D9CCC3|nr:divalent-cation tolerance protein CutA [Knoellia sp. p5-6-4]MDF2144887.1 divalent-cation tolerance protein CutA [Knoellia sp. p5-6-4]
MTGGGDPSELIEVRVAAPDAETAQALARALVEGRLAACAQVLGPMTSTYWWEDEVETAQEHLLLVKTTAELFDPICDRVRAEHPYDNPEVLAVPVAGAAPPYAAWLRESVTPREP